MQLLSIQVGLPRSHCTDQARDSRPPEWLSGFTKESVTGPVCVGHTNLAGDGQADLQNHGGPDKAALAYAAGHYPAWRAELNRPDLPFGAFAENLTIAGLDEQVVCLGDLYAIGEVWLEVSQPRYPCWKIARRWGIPDLTHQVLHSGRTGWYLRVRREGTIAAGQAVVLQARPYPEWTVAQAMLALRGRYRDPGRAQALTACPALSEAWRMALSGV